MSVPRIRRALVVLDACLLLGSALALSWYFLLAPIYLDSRETLLGKLVNLSFPVGDLAVLFGLTVILLRSDEYAVERAVVALLIAAIACLVVADSWDAHPAEHVQLPDGQSSRAVLAGLLSAGPAGWPGAVPVRAARVGRSEAAQPAAHEPRRQDLLASIRFYLPHCRCLARQRGAALPG